MRLFADVNCLAIVLVDDHPGNPGVTTELGPALQGKETLVTFGYAPLRVQWLLTNEMGIDRDRAASGVQSLLDRPMEFLDVQQSIVEEAYNISEYKDHDVYDSFYIAAARAADVDRLVSTDTDFRELCHDEQFDYCQPVSTDTLADFGSFS